MSTQKIGARNVNARMKCVGDSGQAVKKILAENKSGNNAKPEKTA